MPPELREKELQKSLRKAAKLLVAHGIVVQDAVVFRLNQKNFSRLHQGTSLPFCQQRLMMGVFRLLAP
ncbi:MAG: hypothetical protein FWH34_09560 [Desulfovibrionaceae bacterium]|nr:hypothetical protein [Desulfovibrionaceae bacterium]